MTDERPAPDITRLPIRRNVALLSAAVAANASMLQLTSAVAWLSLARVLDVKGLLGLGPAIVLAAGALAALPAGRAMDRRGRIPVLASGFALGAAGCGLAALGSAYDSAMTPPESPRSRSGRSPWSSPPRSGSCAPGTHGDAPYTARPTT